MNADLVKAVDTVIKERSRNLSKFSPPNAIAYSTEEMEQILWDWCNNFDGLIQDYSLLADIIRGIKIIEDNDIITAFYKCKKHIVADNKKYYYCPFGETSASSHRITAFFHKDSPSYNDSLPVLLDQIEKEVAVTGKYPRIFFIDDFLNSGGQFKRIINGWGNNTKLSDAEVDSNHEVHLTEMQIKTLRKCNLDFFFYLCKENKKIELEDFLQKNFPNGKIHVQEQIPEYGIFGSDEDIDKIIHRSDEYISQKSIFSGKKGKELYDLYYVCSEAGIQLLKKNEPKWDERTIQERFLGYGNSPQLYIGQNNVPTFTMTALWHEGPVNINEKKFYWKHMFPRRKKMTTHSENHVKAEKLIPRLDKKGNNSSHSFEVHIVGELENISPDIIEKVTVAPDMLKSYISSDIIDSLKIGLEIIPKECYQKYNNHLKWFVAEKQSNIAKYYPVFISRIQLLRCDARTVFSVYFIINAEGENAAQLYPLLKQAREIKYKTKKWNNGYLSLKMKQNELKKYSFPELITNIFNDINCKIAKDNLFLLYFMRFDSGTQPCEKMQIDQELMHILTLDSANDFDFFLKDAAVAVTEKVGAFICKNHPINNSGSLQKEVADVYCTLEMLSRRLINLAQIHHIAPQRLSNQDQYIFNTNLRFLQRPYSQNEHVKKYMNLLQKRMGEYLNDSTEND